MSYSTKNLSRRLTGALLFVFALGFAPMAFAQTGSCVPSTGDAYLDINNVRARIPNNGNLFWRSDPNVYEVPKGGGANAIFASGVWFAGIVDGTLRAAATRYGPYEFWSGPLDENGAPPSDCSVFDKVWKVNRADITAFNGGAPSTNDMASWPTGLGAPTLAPADTDTIDNDGDGDVDELGEMRSITKEVLALPLAQRISRVVDLAGGERPDVTGDQSLWWIMNDRGNVHNATDTPPIGLEVHGFAFAFNQAGDIGNTTFYKYNVFYKGDVPLTEAYMGIFSDPDLGNFDDDYVGSDSTLGIGYVYNADNEDEGSNGYGPAPPAAGYDFFQGPIVPGLATDTAYVSTVPVPGFVNLPMTYFAFYNNASGIYGDPSSGADYYNYMSGRWKDGSRWTYGGQGNVEGARETDFMFPTDPTTGEFWSEFNSDGAGTALPPADRRFAMATGPFTINPNDQQEIVFGVIWARGTDNLDSVTKMFAADRRAQAAFDANFNLPNPPDAPTVTFTALNRQVAIEWDNAAASNNFLDTYRVFNPLGNPDQPFYEFEGYEVIQFTSNQGQLGTVIATYDVVNGVTSIIDDLNEDGITELTTQGKDNGLQHAHVVSGLTNAQTYFFGVRSYAYNDGSIPKAFYSPSERFTVVPAKSSKVLSEDAVAAAAARGERDIVAVRTAGVGDGTVSVDIVNPGAIKACEYQVRFYALAASAASKIASATTEEGEADVQAFAGNRVAVATVDKGAAAGETTYDVFCGTEKVFDGSAGSDPAPQRDNIFVSDGLEFSIAGPLPGIKNFLAVSNANGPLDPPEMGAFAFNGNGYPLFEGSDRPDGARQQANGSTWGMSVGGGGDTGTYADFLARSLRGDNIDFVGISDYEMRFTAAGGQGYRRFDDGAVFNVPFELWRTGISTPDDTSDDVRMIPAVCEEACGGGTDSLTYDLGTADHGVSGGTNDPFTDWVYWFTPVDESPGSAGYDSFFAAGSTDDVNEEVFARTVLVNWNGGDVPGPYDAALPEEGTVFRIVTFKPNQPDDVHTFSTVGFDAAAASQEVQVARLEDIGIVPNPYKGASSYEVSQIVDEVRFTNLPDVATIRVFTLNGTLLRTIVKNSPGSRTLTWDLTTENLLPIASGMYLIHVDVPGVGEHVMKFGVVKKRVQLNTF